MQVQMRHDGMRSIGQLAGVTGLTLRAIRHYEEAGLIRPAARTRGGLRRYDQADVDRLRLIQWLRALDFSLEQIRGELDASHLDRIVFVQKVTVRLGEERDELAAAGAAIDRLRELLPR
ncbi:MerR family transcriptional regulator [Clavibacter sp. Sh2141]|uniref:MerR family transcriptional regulator n=1 Tax=unclassified Clavibacter TaxID=2626594 RepID=UPI0039BC2B22